VIIVAGKMTFKSEDREDVLHGLQEVVARSRHDAGCVDYWWSEDIETANAFRFFECWESQGLMEAHMALSHTDDFMKSCVSRLIDVEAHTYQVSGRQ
jgi:quinol monooxygenase YgiN